MEHVEVHHIHPDTVEGIRCVVLTQTGVHAATVSISKWD